MKQYSQKGFSYLVALFLVAIFGVLSLKIVGDIQTQTQREKEAELLWIGNAYQRAIQSYYEKSPGSVKKFPRKLSELLLDKRYTKNMRYLRKLYPDPVTGKDEWGIIKNENGEITGVYSLSDLRPIKQANFDNAQIIFNGARTYQDWKFVYYPM